MFDMHADIILTFSDAENYPDNDQNDPDEADCQQYAKNNDHYH